MILPRVLANSVNFLCCCIELGSFLKYKVLAAEDFLEDVPYTAVTLQLALYYYSLQIYIAVNPTWGSEPSVLYTKSPTKVMEKVLHHVTYSKKLDWPPEVMQMVTKLKQYNELLEDFIQAKQLQSLDRGESKY